MHSFRSSRAAAIAALTSSMFFCPARGMAADPSPTTGPSAASRPGEAPLPPVVMLFDASHRGGWEGVGKDGAISADGATFAYPTGPSGWYQRGFRREHDASRDWRRHELSVEVELADDAPVTLVATVRLPAQPARLDYRPETAATVRLAGRGVHRVALPWSTFDFPQAAPSFLRFAHALSIKMTDASGAAVGGASLRSVRLARAERVLLDADVRGRSIAPGGTAEYAVAVTNTDALPQPIVLSFERHGWEADEATVEPDAFLLSPGESRQVSVRVRLSDRVPAGGRVEQTLRAVAGGDGRSAARLKLVTAAALPHPYVLHTADRWAEVRDKVKNHEWAQTAQAEVVSRAEKWAVPDVARAPKNLTNVDDMGPFLFQTAVEKDLMAAGTAYQLTGDVRFAEKIRTFLLRLSDPDVGYPVTLRGCNQSLVQEGHFFQHIAMTYDMALPSGLFTPEDRLQVERTLRTFMETIDFETGGGAINNWNLSEICGALYSALVLQDLAAADRFYRGPGGVIDQLAKGVLDDGWWYECSISYNVWCASEFTQVALAMEPWGESLAHARVPAAFVPQFSLVPWASKDGLYGQSFEKWGPVTKNYVDIKRMWDALPKFADYRGVMFGVNDATEAQLGGSAFELAYYVYRDPAYAQIVKQNPSGARDLLFGVPELPEATGDKFRQSAFADNVGLAMLRSQTPDRPIREQIQAVLHYGTHGGFHGHFDRTSLLHLSRYGRSFFNPEMVWYSYAPFMYKFYVQNSTSKNMVVVDRKMQEPVESRRLLWQTGPLFQAAAVETTARWSTPPYGGMVYPEQGYRTLQDKAWGEGRFLPRPDPEPAYGSVTQFTEPIRQRRLMIVTDDYVVLADHLKGAREHVFESLFQMKGLAGIEGADVAKVRHDAQWDPNPILDAQFVTDADWYTATAPTRAAFTMRWGPGADNEGTRAPASEDGVLNLDVHHLWPLRQEQMVATAPEAHPVEKRLFWTVRGDGRELAAGRLGAWILGRADVDVPVDGLRELELETRVELSKRSTVFWANARVVTTDGREIPLSQLDVKYDNVEPAKGRGQDYYGGPIKIAGEPFGDAAPGQPKDAQRPGVARIDLRGVGAARFRATLGSDYPLGDEAQRRKTYASKVVGSEARFVTVIEPFEDRRMVKSAAADGPNRFRVELADGRVQMVTIDNLDGGGRDIAVRVEESRGGSATRSQVTDAAGGGEPARR